MYNHSQNADFLRTAQRAATYFLDHIPSDGIVPWYVDSFLFQMHSLLRLLISSRRDFNAPLDPPPRPADSSAATIAANGLLLLAQVDPSQADKWTNAAINVRSFDSLQAELH